MRNCSEVTKCCNQCAIVVWIRKNLSKEALHVNLEREMHVTFPHKNDGSALRVELR